MKERFMKIVHSGFDSLYFSLQGALSAQAIKRYEMLKSLAIEKNGNEVFEVVGRSTRYSLQPNGKRGGYTYLIDTGLVGSTLCFKTSLSRDQHNGFVEISSACLLAYGWKAAIEQTLDHVAAVGFHVESISFNRVDYCIDFLDAQIEIYPRDFIVHSRVKKRAYHEPLSVINHVEKRSVAQSDHVKSLTLGTMPGRQIILYDKRAEAIERRKLYWFDAWGIDRHDTTRTVHRVEVRAGKNHLMANRLRTLDDFECHIGLILQNAVRDMRWVQRSPTDANVSRAPLHPLWQAVQAHMRNALAPYTAPLSQERITERMRNNKRLEYRQQVVGNLGGYMACGDVAYEDIQQEMQALIADISEQLSSDSAPPLIKAYNRTKERWGSV
jgi:uncharacterized protein YcfL